MNCKDGGEIELKQEQEQEQELKQEQEQEQEQELEQEQEQELEQELEQEQLDWKDDIGIERIDCEYKVFNFNPLKLSIDDGAKYLSSGIFSFNDSVEETLGNYISIYLPKYICSFFNPRSMLKKSNLYFGIDDDGKVIGIPYTGRIHENFINHMIDKVFSSHMKFPSTQIKDKIRQLVKVEIIPVSKTKIVSKQTNPTPFPL